MKAFPLTGLALLVPMLTLAACGERDEPADSAAMDASDPAVVDGLSPSEIRQQAEPMSPEQAAELGIVDTTIHIEDPTLGDTITLPPDSAL